MKIVNLSLDRNEETAEGMALAIGFFDGIHLGHRMLLEDALASGYRPAILTFSVEMKAKLSSLPLSLLLTEKEKEERMESSGIESYFLLPFDDQTMTCPKNRFQDFLSSLKPKKVIVGEDFTFGNKGEGKAHDLLSLQEKGIQVSVVSLKYDKGKKLSSSVIKKEILAGEIETANSQLGYSYFQRGRVIHGYANGRKIGFPTANFQAEKDKVLLPSGVYKTRTLVDGKEYFSMTNIGNHPTIHPLEDEILETHVIGLDEDLYGKEIEVRFLSFLRPQIRFSSLEELKSQLKKDVVIAGK